MNQVRGLAQAMGYKIAASVREGAGPTFGTEEIYRAILGDVYDIIERARALDKGAPPS
jgi:hypothetical protein